MQILKSFGSKLSMTDLITPCKDTLQTLVEVNTKRWQNQAVMSQSYSMLRSLTVFHC